MAIRLRLGDEVFLIPTVGDSNWGESVSLYLKKNSEIIANLQGPQDISLTDFPAKNGLQQQNIDRLSFDASTIQQILVEGFIIRTFQSSPAKVDSFTIEGVFDGSDFIISPTYVGTNAKVTLDVKNTGQFTYTAEYVEDTANILIRFRAKAIIKLDI
jgi:hypothetical protein